MEPDDVASATRTAGELESCRRALREARDELERSREHLALFAAQVSHDLRTPLTAVLANAEMLAAEPVVSEDRDLGWMVAAVERGARRMDTMIEQMLAYARGGGAPVLTTTPLDQVFEHALEELAPLVEAQHAEVVLGSLPTLPVDADQLRAVAHELVSNAIRFSRPGVPPRVAVCSQRLPGHWRVTVSDNGIGIEADRRDAMLLPLARADKRVEGSGMGLAIAKRVVEAHGGRIGIDACPDGGTTVWFDLPG